MMELAAGMVEEPKLPCGRRPLTCIEEELADIIIRTLDTAQAFGVDIDRAVTAKMAYNATRPHRHGGKLA
jgi:NTP pyrophosphatase (non-canonical NTP hydrolase)